MGKRSFREGITKSFGKALVQIDSKHYADEMRNEGTKELMKLGIAFSGKKVIVTAG